MNSKRRHEGYLLIDNTAGPGVDAGMLAELERRAGKKATVAAGVGEGRKLEAALLTCPHCHKQMIVNPLRTRERAWCAKCDHYICDECGLIRKLGDDRCRHGFIDRAAERAARDQQRGVILP